MRLGRKKEKKEKKKASQSSKVLATEATAGTAKVKVLNAPVGRGHRGSLPILQRLNMLKIIYLFLPGKRVNFALQYVFLIPYKKYCSFWIQKL